MITGSAHKHGTTAALAERLKKVPLKQDTKYFALTQHSRMYIPVSDATNASALASVPLMQMI